MVELKYWAVLLGCIIATALALPNTKYSGLEAENTQDVVFVEESTEEAKLPQIQRRTDDSEVERTTEAVKLIELPLAEAETEPETEPETTVPETEPYFEAYAVDGDVLDLDLQRFLYEQLWNANIVWWMPYAMLTAYQESSFDVNQITNGLDCGLFQYRNIYWPETAARYGFSENDLMNPYVQIVVYVQQTAKRLASGCSIYETISRHKTSDWGAYDQTYVDQVLSHSITQIQ